MIKSSLSRRTFLVCNLVFLTGLSLLCVLPILNVLAVSFSSAGAAAAGEVRFWPVDFNVKAYEVVMKEGKFFGALGMSAERLLLGTLINMVLCVLTAYPLSKDSRRFPLRTAYAWIFVFTILFNGGLIPWYLAVKQTHLLDTVWALILPGAVNVFNIILMLNFFRGLPKELEESSLIDGAGHLKTLFLIFLPISLPSLATVTLFTMVGHWNSWFDGLMLMKSPERYPLATYLQSIEIDLSTLRQLNLTDPDTARVVSNRTGRAAQIFMTALPILIVYPFLQKYFVSGLVMGSVKE